MLSNCLALFVLSLGCATVAATISDTPDDGTIWNPPLDESYVFNDVDGNPVHAHGAGLIEQAGVYYMVGATQKLPPHWLSEGINLYSSSDLQHWKFEALIFKNTSITTGTSANHPYRIERPKILKNAKTGKFVMWFHLDDAKFSMQSVGVAVSDTINGQYEYVAGFQPDGQESYDMGLFQDTDGSAYLARSVRNKVMGISKLTDDYLNTTGIISQNTICEGQALFKDGDDYFLVCSHLTGWSANAMMMFTTKGPLGKNNWTSLGNPCQGPQADKTFNSQSTYVLVYTHPVTKKNLIMYMGDRWNNGGKGSVGNASYVWLPMQRDGMKFTMNYNTSWKIKDF